MTQKIQEKIDWLHIRLDDTHVSQIEKDTHTRQIVLLKNASYSIEAREFFLDHNLSSPDEMLPKLVKQCFAALTTSDGQNHMEIKGVVLRNKETGQDYTNPFLFLFGTNSYGKKIIIHCEGYTNANPIRQPFEINLWGWYNKITCDASSCSASNDMNPDFKPTYLIPHCNELLTAYTKFMEPLMLEKEDPHKLANEFKTA